MRAVQLHAYGHAPTLDEVPDPVIRRPDDVLVRVGAAGLCRTDVHIIDGVFAHLSKPLPTVLGHETAGWIEAVGSDVTDLMPGDPVVLYPQTTCGSCPACRRGSDQFCERFQFLGAGVDGGFAELVLTTARGVVKLGTTSPVDAAGLADGGLAAYGAVKRVVDRLPPGSTAVVVGAGGVGHVAVQLLRALTQARVLVIDVSQAALQLGRRLGATMAIAADGGEVAAVREATAGRGAEVVLDFVGEAGTPARSLAMLRRQGTYVAVGYGGELQVATGDLVYGGWTILGSAMGTNAELVELLALADAGGVAVTSKAYPLAAFADAIEDLRQGRVLGRAVLLAD